nr:immunoglobulin heavy chain junction region [Mus musculus]
CASTVEKAMDYW